MTEPEAPTAPPVRQVHDIPDSTHARSDIEKPDYIDQFILTASNARAATPRQWAQATFEDTAGRGGQFIWRALLLLRLNRGPDRVAGWEISGSGDDWITIAAESPMMTAELIIQLSEREVSLATITRYRNRIGRIVWGGLSPIHRRLTPDLLRDSHRLLFG